MTLDLWIRQADVIEEFKRDISGKSPWKGAGDKPITKSRLRSTGQVWISTRNNSSSRPSKGFAFIAESPEVHLGEESRRMCENWFRFLYVGCSGEDGLCYSQRTYHMIFMNDYGIRGKWADAATILLPLGASRACAPDPEGAVTMYPSLLFSSACVDVTASLEMGQFTPWGDFRIMEGEPLVVLSDHVVSQEAIEDVVLTPYPMWTNILEDEIRLEHGRTEIIVKGRNIYCSVSFAVQMTLWRGASAVLDFIMSIPSVAIMLYQ